MTPRLARTPRTHRCHGSGNHDSSDWLYSLRRASHGEQPGVRRSWGVGPRLLRQIGRAGECRTISGGEAMVYELGRWGSTAADPGQGLGDRTSIAPAISFPRFPFVANVPHSKSAATLSRADSLRSETQRRKVSIRWATQTQVNRVPCDFATMPPARTSHLCDCSTVFLRSCLTQHCQSTRSSL